MALMMLPRVYGRVLLAATVFLTGGVSATADDERYLRVVEKEGETLALEVAARRFAPAEGEGPEVALVSVAHIADAALYRALQKYLDEFDLVLFESVAPPGADRPAGEDDEARAASTRQALQFIAGLAELYRNQRDRYPATLDDLTDFAKDMDERMVSWLALALTDAWGAAVLYEADEAGDSCQLTSFGADGKRGGDEAARDIVLESGSTDPLQLESDEGIQAKLAELLDMEFQLDSMDYARANFRASDMTMDELEHAFEARGLDFGPLSSTLAGSAFPPVLVDTLIKFMRILDIAFEGMLSDMMKVVMIEMLGDETLTEKLLDQQFGGGFTEVIVGDRNQIVMDDLKRVIEDEPEVESVAILYGAAHMPDFEERLREQLGYEPAAVEWIPAMTVDLRATALSAAEIQQIRTMLRRMLQRMAR